MFSIGDKAIDKSGKIFRIDCVVDKDFGQGPTPYFAMSPCFPYDFNPGYQCFIPVDRADVLLRPLMSREAADNLLLEIKSIPIIKDIGPHERKAKFQAIVSTGNRKDILQVILTLLAYRNERRKLNKPFLDFDNRLLKNLTTLFQDEMSIVFDMTPEEVAQYIETKSEIPLFS